VATPLDYTSTRSFFSHQQRFEQSLQTIDSIKQYNPDIFVVFMEGTALPEEMREGLVKKADYFFDASQVEWVQECVNGPYKSRGEIATFLSYLQSEHFQGLKEGDEVSSVSKVSGRYHLGSGFQLEVVPSHIVAKVTLDVRYHPEEYMSTLFYTVAGDLLDDFVAICERTYLDESIQAGKPLECVLLKVIKERGVQVHRKVGMFNVCGEYGPWGGYVCH
jgi:hypothetical protein